MNRIYSLILEIIGIMFISAGYPIALIGGMIGQDACFGGAIVSVIGTIFYLIGRLNAESQELKNLRYIAKGFNDYLKKRKK